MAEAFARMLGDPHLEVYSAGSKPSGRINPKAIWAMKERGYDLTTHSSKPLEEVSRFSPFDFVITMGCGDSCPWIPAKVHLDWEIPDPGKMIDADFRTVRDLIEKKVEDLIHSAL